MKTLGLIGGMSWESTALYYQHLNSLARTRLGGLHSAQLLMWSFDFSDVAERQHAGDWDGAAGMLIDAANRLERGGADALILCTNTMHKVADQIEAAVSLPLLHIADATAAAMNASGCHRPVLLATRFTMQESFYRARLARHNVEALVPDAHGQDLVHAIIYDELCQGIVRAESRDVCLTQIECLKAEGADSVILGCTEVAMLIGQEHVDLPVFDTTRLHAEAAMEFALEDENV